MRWICDVGRVKLISVCGAQMGSLPTTIPDVIRTPVTSAIGYWLCDAKDPAFAFGSDASNESGISYTRRRSQVCKSKHHEFERTNSLTTTLSIGNSM